MINIVLWAVGLVLLVLGLVKVAGPYGRMRELDRLAENARRYDSWRGGSRSTAADGGRTGADEMRDLMRRQTMIWAGVAAAGIVLLVAGFVVR